MVVVIPVVVDLVAIVLTQVEGRVREHGVNRLFAEIREDFQTVPLEKAAELSEMNGLGRPAKAENPGVKLGRLLRDRQLFFHDDHHTRRVGINASRLSNS